MEDLLRSIKAECKVNNQVAHTCAHSIVPVTGNNRQLDQGVINPAGVEANSGMVDDQAKPSGEGKALEGLEDESVDTAISHINYGSLGASNNMIPYLEFTIKTVECSEILADVNCLGYGPNVYQSPNVFEPWRIPKNEMFCNHFFTFLLSKLGPYASSLESNWVELQTLSIYELRIELKHADLESSADMVAVPQKNKRLEYELNDIFVKHCMNNGDDMNGLFVTTMTLTYQALVLWDIDRNIISIRNEATDTSIYIHNEHRGMEKQTCFKIRVHLKGFSHRCRSEVEVTLDNMNIEFKDLARKKDYASEEYENFSLDLLLLRVVCHLRQRSIRTLLEDQNWTMIHRRYIMFYGNEVQAVSFCFTKQRVVVALLVDKYIKNSVRMAFSFSPDAIEQEPNKDFWRKLPPGFDEFQMPDGCNLFVQVHNLLNLLANAMV